MLSSLAVARTVPTNVAPTTGAVWPVSTSGSPWSQTRTVRSTLVLARRPSGLNARPRTTSVWPDRTRGSPPSTGQTCTVRSLVVATRRPSGLTATACTGALPGRSRWVPSRFHSRVVPSQVPAASSGSFGLNASEMTELAWGSSAIRRGSRGSARSHRRTVLSALAVARIRLSLLNATALTWSTWLSVARMWPVVVSHKRAVRSHPAVASIAPSGVNATCATLSVWAVRVTVSRGWCGSVTSVSCTLRSLPALASSLRRGAYATALTWSLWLVRRVA